MHTHECNIKYLTEEVNNGRPSTIVCNLGIEIRDDILGGRRNGWNADVVKVVRSSTCTTGHHWS